jgi:transcriptional regulator with XRE-family HTH domain
MKAFLKHLATRVRTLRKQQGLSQTKLAQKAGIDYRYIGFLEQGRLNPTLNTLGKVAKALNIALCDLCPPPNQRKFKSVPQTPKQQALDRITFHLQKSNHRQIAKIEQLIKIIDK